MRLRRHRQVSGAHFPTQWLAGIADVLVRKKRQWCSKQDAGETPALPRGEVSAIRHGVSGAAVLTTGIHPARILVTAE